MKRTIEEHYNYLLDRIDRPRSEAAAEVAAEATKIAERVWPVFRSMLAEKGRKLPPKPVVFSHTGGIWVGAVSNIDGRLSLVEDNGSPIYSTLCSRINIGDPLEKDWLQVVLKQALETVSLAWSRERELRMQEWDRYRLAVVQNVALPQEG
jgi:hypothetical protein